MKKNYEDENWKEKMRVKLDFNNMLTEKIGEKQGIKKETINNYQEKTSGIHQKLKEDKRKGKLGFAELPYTEQKVINEIKQTAKKYRGKIKNFVVLGIGGSALGNIALRNALKEPYHNLKNDPENNGIPNLFVPDNVDPDRFNKEFLQNLDLEKTVFNVISKSGGTAETMSQFLVSRKAVIEEVGKDKLNEHFIATTSKDSGYLIKIAKKDDFKTFHIPDNVGGRFSVLTPVGLVFAAFGGIDIEKLLAGARYMDELCDNDDIWKNPAYLNGLLEYLAYQDGKVMSVMMPYAHQLRDMADWYRQLWAESLGKKINREEEIVNVGPTPIKALGATDQHSQVQLYMEGPYDKVINFLEVKNFDQEVKIPEAYSEIEGVSYLGGHSLNKLLKTEKKATELALSKESRINKTIILPEINEFTVGQLFYLFELQTAFIGELFNINAYNQPGVELGKHFTYGILGRNGYENMKKEYDNRPEKNDNYII